MLETTEKEDSFDTHLMLKTELKGMWSIYKNPNRPPYKYELEIYDTLHEYTQQTDPVLLIELLSLLEIKPPLSLSTWCNELIYDVYKRVEKFRSKENTMEIFVSLKKKQREDMQNVISDLVYTLLVVENKQPKEVCVILKEKGYMKADLTTNWRISEISNILIQRRAHKLPSTTLTALKKRV